MTTPEMRELDVWLANNVLGLEARQIQPGMFAVINKRGRIEKELPYYTTDPASAMLVLEQLLVRGEAHLMKLPAKFVITLCSPGDATCGDAPFQPSKTNLYVEGETLPLTICLFAKQLFTTQ